LHEIDRHPSDTKESQPVDSKTAEEGESKDADRSVGYGSSRVEERVNHSSASEHRKAENEHASEPDLGRPLDGNHLTAESENDRSSRTPMYPFACLL
jgi:hypothetical protein